jgi:hypothetical protein
MADQELGLAEAIESVRAELRAAQDADAGADVRFAVGSVEVEFVVELAKKADGEASIKVLNVLSLGGTGDRSRGETNRVTVVLNPIGVSGKPFEASSTSRRRPDAVPPSGGRSGVSGAAQEPATGSGDRTGPGGWPDAQP